MTWLKGFLAALLGGAVASVAQVATSGTVEAGAIKTAAIAGAAIAVVGYLKQSPIPQK